MSGCRMLRRSEILRGAAVAAILLLSCLPAGAIEPPPGTRNFTPPNSVPNYFSNEAAPFREGAQAAQPGADRFNAAPAVTPASLASTPPPSYAGRPSTTRSAYRGKKARGKVVRSRGASSRQAARAARTRAGRAAVLRVSTRPAATSTRPAATSKRPAPAKGAAKAAATHGRSAAGATRHAARGTRYATRSAR